MKILIFRLSAIGDIILTSGLVRCLKQQVPGCQIDFVVKKQFSSLVSDNPHISHVYEVDSALGFGGLKQLATQLKANEYDVFFDIHKNFRSRFVRNASSPEKVLKYDKHVLKRFMLTRFNIDLYKPAIPVYQRFIQTAASLGVKDDGRKTEFFINPDVQKRISAKLVAAELLPLNYICLCPGASFWNKQWPIEYFIALAQKINSTTSYSIVLIGGAKEKELSAQIKAAVTAAIDMTGALNLQESAAVLSSALCTVANDTGMLHLSEALGRPVVGIYGPTARQLGYFPLLPTSIVAENNKLTCRPCTKMGMNTCPKKHFKCMMDLSPQSVFDAVLSICTSATTRPSTYV